MKTLDLNQLEEITGGERSAFIDGFCAGATIATFIAPNPITGVATGVCVIREGYLFWR